jgi:hypothetical protein
MKRVVAGVLASILLLAVAAGLYFLDVRPGRGEPPAALAIKRIGMGQGLRLKVAIETQCGSGDLDATEKIRDQVNATGNGPKLALGLDVVRAPGSGEAWPERLYSKRLGPKGNMPDDFAATLSLPGFLPGKAVYLVRYCIGPAGGRGCDGLSVRNVNVMIMKLGEALFGLAKIPDGTEMQGIYYQQFFQIVDGAIEFPSKIVGDEKPLSAYLADASWRLRERVALADGLVDAQKDLGSLPLTGSDGEIVMHLPRGDGSMCPFTPQPMPQP